MASTPIYNWPTPDNTGLVKNGALDMRTLGNAIDTTMATMTPKSLVDAKGDIVTATANDTPARLAVGANGETLVADASTSTGLRYQGSMAAGKNGFINGGFDVWQRGTSFTSGGAYVADRWYLGGSNPNMTISRVTGTDGSTYAMRLQRNSGSTSTAGIPIGQSVEIANATPYQGKTITVSFMARAGANFSATSNNVSVNFITGTSSTEANRMVVAYASGDTTAINSVATLTTSWQRFSYTTTLGATVSQFFLYIERPCTGTAGANDWMDITNVQIEVGSVATNFTRVGGTIQGELSAAQRYYWRQTATGGDAYFGNGNAGTTTEAYIVVKHPVSMRVAPTAIDFSGLNVQAITASQNATSANITNAGTDWTLVRAVVASGLTATTQPYMLRALSSSSNFLGLSAEL